MAILATGPLNSGLVNLLCVCLGDSAHREVLFPSPAFKRRINCARKLAHIVFCKSAKLPPSMLKCGKMQIGRQHSFSYRHAFFYPGNRWKRNHYGYDGEP